MRIRWTRAFIAASCAIAFTVAAHVAVPGIVQPPLGTDAMRRAAIDHPQAMIDRAHARLKAADGNLDVETERGLLWWMGSAALNLGDDATLTEAVLRLDSLHHVGHDPLAGAAANYLRAFHQILNGDAGGLVAALRAAALVQDSDDPRVRAWSGYQLCDAYTQAGEAAQAVPVCRQAAADARKVGDAWELADDENDLGWNASAMHKYAEAIAWYEQSRARFASIGAEQVVAQVGDNLAHTLLLVGRPREALKLSEASLEREKAAGNESDALLSRANIARAEAALHHPRRAEQVIKAAIDEARRTSNRGLLPDFYAADSRFAEAAGDMPRALASARKVGELLRQQRHPSVLAAERALEDRYQARERELRISELQRENGLSAMQLNVAQAQSQRERAWVVAALLGVIALLVIIWLLYLLLRAQRRHADSLRELSLRDPLTGVDNRRSFMQAAGRLVDTLRTDQAARHALLLIDLDHFKHVNDSDGHPAGDRVLVQVVRQIEHAAGTAVTLARLGGEEFALLCADTSADAARALALDICRRVAHMPLPLPEDSPIERITVSIGVAILDGVSCTDMDSWLRTADAALYQAKSDGRNRVVVAGDDAATRVG